MRPVLAELVEILSLERLEQTLFRGQSQDLGWGAIFGGQVLGQALSAAVQTTPDDRFVHVVHAHFLRRGDARKPVIYDVDAIRDGSSFTSRRVVAIQNGKPIFHLSASFQVMEDGFDHQAEMPQVKAPEALLSDRELALKFAERIPEPLRAKATAERPIELRVEGGVNPFAPEQRPPKKSVWMRTTDAVSGEPWLHQALLAYASDFHFLVTSLHPHEKHWLTPGMQTASLDHVLWFHRPFRMDDWLLHEMESPSASGARGLVRGQVFDRAGRLVASTAQEGLIRDHTLNQR